MRVRRWLELDNADANSSKCLSLMAKYLTSYPNETQTPAVLADTFEFVLSTVNGRAVQFVNSILKEMSVDAPIDDKIRTAITSYMTDRLKDNSEDTRVQAVQALQRFQASENPDDAIVHLYRLHLANDSSALVRKEVISAIRKNSHTIPSIIQRADDEDENVRCQIYIEVISLFIHKRACICQKYAIFTYR